MVAVVDVHGPRPVLRSKSCTRTVGSWRAPTAGVTPHHAPQEGTSFAETVQFADLAEALRLRSESPGVSLSPPGPEAHATSDAASHEGKGGAPGGPGHTSVHGCEL